MWENICVAVVPRTWEKNIHIQISRSSCWSELSDFHQKSQIVRKFIIPEPRPGVNIMQLAGPEWNSNFPKIHKLSFQAVGPRDDCHTLDITSISM